MFNHLISNIPDIFHRIEINAPAKKVYEALITRNGLSGWWTTEVEAEPKVGSVATFHFDDLVNKMKIADLQDSKLVEWECIAGHDDWIDSTLTFDLAEAARLYFALRKKTSKQEITLATATSSGVISL